MLADAAEKEYSAKQREVQISNTVILEPDMCNTIHVLNHNFNISHFNCS